MSNTRKYLARCSSTSASESIVTEPQPPRPVIYMARLQSRSGADIHALRAILKALLRKFGWRCVSIETDSKTDE